MAEGRNGTALRDKHSERSKQGWATRRGRSKCGSCGRTGETVYSVPEIHPVRDLCIDCAWAVCEANRV